MNPKDREQLKEFNEKLDVIQNKLNEIDRTIIKKPNRKDKIIDIGKQVLKDFIISGIIIGLIFQLWIVPTIDESKEFQMLEGLKFQTISASTKLSNESADVVYYFSAFNNNKMRFNRYIKLKIDFGNVNISVKSIESNEEDYDVITENSILIIKWNHIPAKTGETGEIISCVINISCQGEIKNFVPLEPIIIIEDYGKVWDAIYIPMVPKNLLDNIKAKISVERGLVTNEYMDLEYKITILNDNEIEITQDLNLKIIFDLDSISVSSIDSNIAIKNQNITNNSIYFVWDSIPPKINNESGAVYFTIQLYRYLLEGDTRIISDETIPKVDVWIDDFGIVNTDLSEFW
jgi:hypothetical protein